MVTSVTLAALSINAYAHAEPITVAYVPWVVQQCLL